MYCDALWFYFGSAFASKVDLGCFKICKTNGAQPGGPGEVPGELGRAERPNSKRRGHKELIIQLGSIQFEPKSCQKSSLGALRGSHLDSILVYFYVLFELFCLLLLVYTFWQAFCINLGSVLLPKPTLESFAREKINLRF